MQTPFLTSSELRKIFLDFFSEKGHMIVKSSSLVPKSDPTLLFTNAGMVQFKDVFLGRERMGYVCAASSQKCMRAGGKHNDLEVVGKTNRHHTFFEMLGNFSFGDYFKERAINIGWEFLTKTLLIPKDRLWVTVYKDDDEAFRLWHEMIGLQEKRIFRLGDKDNFWSMGDTGPCGPCSEIFYDCGEKNGCGSSDCGVECECDRYMELWNLVFMQYDRDSDGNLKPLPKPSIDTGMGLERLSAVIQGVQGNFDTDIFTPIMKKIGELSSQTYGNDNDKDISFRVIADHSRSATFLISDGVFPSNEGRGYVLRRIIRRAARHGKILGLNQPFLFRLITSVIEVAGKGYPDLIEQADVIKLNIRNEEERFSSALEYGTNILEEVLASPEVVKSNQVPGEKLFKLYDTYGFPLDISKEIAEERGFAVDIDGFNSSMEDQKKRARASWKGDNGITVNDIYSKLLLECSATEFVGYEDIESTGEILAILKKGKIEREVREGEDAEFILNRSVFYGESGGQEGDRGLIWNESGSVDVIDTKIPVRGLIAHHGRVKSGIIKNEDHVKMLVESAKRADTERNHSATHLLHTALREVLGDHVKQAGSYVSADRLRFDYTHFSTPSKEEIHRVETKVNEIVLENVPIATMISSFDEAVRSGAMALFGEKYGDKVRVVTIGDYSSELCGGTHTQSTGRIGLFKIIHDGGIAAGIRRIEAITGRASYDFIHSEEERLYMVRRLLRSAPNEETNKLERLLEKNRELERELNKAREKMVTSGNDLLNYVRKVRDIKVLTKKLENIDKKNLRLFIDSVKVKIKSGVVVAGCVIDNKVSLAAGVTKDLTSLLNAGKIVGEMAKIVDGKGGGRADMAQAGGTEISRIEESLEAVYKIIEQMLNE